MYVLICLFSSLCVSFVLSSRSYGFRSLCMCSLFLYVFMYVFGPFGRSLFRYYFFSYVVMYVCISLVIYVVFRSSFVCVLSVCVCGRVFPCSFGMYFFRCVCCYVLVMSVLLRSLLMYVGMYFCISVFSYVVISLSG